MEAKNNFNILGLAEVSTPKRWETASCVSVASTLFSSFSGLCDEDNIKAPTFNSGETKLVLESHDRNKDVVKIGSATGITRGDFFLYGTSVRLSDLDIPLDQSPQQFQSRNLRFKKQYEIMPRHLQTFAKPGDSGALVFLIDTAEDKTDKFICIGMVVGGTSHSSVVVTPIGEVLEALGLPKKTLHQFVPDTASATGREA